MNREDTTMADDTTFDLARTYVHLEDGPRVDRIAVSDDFWQTIADRPELRGGRLVLVSRSGADWDHWEMHPEGDEIVYLLSGALDVILEEDGQERTVELRDRTACIVPRGVWHRGIVRAPAETLHITRGAGTQHRPI